QRVWAGGNKNVQPVLERQEASGPVPRTRAAAFMGRRGGEMKLPLLLFAAAALAMASTSCPARDRLAECAAVRDRDQRLQCYDDLARAAASASGTTAEA